MYLYKYYIDHTHVHADWLNVAHDRLKYMSGVHHTIERIVFKVHTPGTQLNYTARSTYRIIHL